MAASPFHMFRRNQRQMMVVVTGLAMFAFIFVTDSGLQNGELPRSLSVLLIAMLCAGGMWIIGNPRGKGNELALYGAIIGGAIAFFGLRANGQLPLAVTSIGNFSRDDLQQIAQRRGFANRFVAMATKNARAAFGGTDDESLVQRAILLHEARQRGIAVSSEAVSEYISQITENKLSQADYKGILNDMGLSEADLYSVLREELQAQLALTMDLPPALQSGMGPVQTPLTYWKQYKMLQVRQALDVAAVPIEPFMAKVPEPNDKELQAYFDQWKNQLPNPATGEPGFLVDRQVNLAYVAADFEAFEKLVSEPTDEEVVAFYEANKQRYPVLDIPDMDDPGLMPYFEQETAPASALDPVNAPAAAALEETPDTPEAPAGGDEKSPPAPALPENGEAAARKREIPVQLVSFLQDTEPDAAPAKPEPPASAAEETPAADPSAPATPALELPPGPASGSVLEVPTLDMPPSRGSPTTPAEPKYRDLDEGLKLEIRETILRDRAFEAMGLAVDQAFNEMNKLADEYLGVIDPEQLPAKAEELTTRLKALAQVKNLAYIETGLLTRDQLLTSVNEPIGSAVEPSDNPFQRGAPVAQQVFGNDTLFYPHRADSMLRDKRYAYWKLADVPPRVPTLAEAKERVVTEWKRMQARPLAEKRAQQLQQLVAEAGKPLVDALSGQTITGDPDGVPVSVRETPRFSWMSMPRNLPFQFNPMFMPPPTLSTIDGVVQPGRGFMKTVFEELGPGETGVAANEPRTVYYVAHVKQRDATPSESPDNLGLKALQQQFLAEGRTGFEQGPYMYLGRDEIMQLLEGWRKRYQEQYSITFENPEPLPEDL